VGKLKNLTFLGKIGFFGKKNRIFCGQCGIVDEKLSVFPIFWGKNLMYRKKSDFWDKMRFCGKNLIFLEKYLIFLGKYRISWEKIGLVGKNSVFCGNNRIFGK
jgi:hypothetical protein